MRSSVLLALVFLTLSTCFASAASEKNPGPVYNQAWWCQIMAFICEKEFPVDLDQWNNTAAIGMTPFGCKASTDPRYLLDCKKPKANNADPE